MKVNSRYFQRLFLSVSFRLPNTTTALTGLSVCTGLNAQKLLVDGMGWIGSLNAPISKAPTIGGACRKKIRQNLGFCPNKGGWSGPIPTFLNQNHMVILLGFCHNKGGFPSPNHFHPQKWDFFMKKIIYLE